MLILLSILWFIWELKYVLFWLYLWQLKEYHVGRFVDHFSTQKGQKLLLDWWQIAKLVLFWVPFVIYFIYLYQAFGFLGAVLAKRVKKPVITFKTIFLTLVSFAVVVLFLASNPSLAQLVAFDILTPIIISIIVLIFQPFFVFARNLKLKKAKEKLQKFKNLKTIAITGSYGKTSTKEFLTTILSEKFKVLSTSKHQNAEIGIANCILNDLKSEHQIFIAEVGAYNKGKVKEVCNVLQPKIGIVTGVNEQHLSLFGSMENLLLAEGGGELAQFLEKNGLLVVNGDNKYCLDLIKKFNGKEKIYSENKNIVNIDIWAEEISAHKDFISFIATDKAGELAHFEVKVLGKQNVQNLLGAILVAKELGMSFGEISEACKNIKQEQAGMILKKGKHGLEIIDSSYSANPDGVFADLNYLSIFPNKKIIVMPCLIELGKKSSEIHEKIGKKIAEVCDFAIITSKDKFKELERGFNSVIPEKSGIQIMLIENPQEIYSAITLFCKSGDAVLLEGRVPQKLHELL